jgi:hypothetical protein
MNALRLGKAVLALPVLLALVAPAAADDLPPNFQTIDPTIRDLRPGHVREWYIYNDRNTNGILDPGDERIDVAANWWAPISSHSQHNYSRDGGGFQYGPDDDAASGPINGAASVDGSLENYWLPREKNAVGFYMGYSQYDNADWKGGYDGGYSGTTGDIVRQRHEERNGYTFAWVTHEKNAANSDPQTRAGFVEMDVFVHRGRGLNPNPDGSVDVPGWGKSYSNPQVSVSNDIGPAAADFVGAEGQRHPLVWDESTGSYSLEANRTRIEANFPGLTTDAQKQDKIDEIVASAEFQERVAADLAAGEVIWDDRRPEQIAADLTEHDGVTPYLYEDAFQERSVYHDEATDGGLIAGLAGEEDYVFDPGAGVNTWADQQVIRVDVSRESLKLPGDSDDPTVNGQVEKIIFWDFGYDPGSGQLTPRQIVLDLSDLGQFPEHRFYVAQVALIPEPATAVLVGLGAMLLAARRRRRAAS